MKLNPYLNFGDKTEEAFEFYKTVFGNEFAFFQRFKDAPGTEEGDAEKVMHVALPIGNDTLMGSDSPASMMSTFKIGNNISLSLQPDSKEQADELFSKLSEGGVVLMPLADQFWNAYFGMLTDKYGVNWMINYAYPQGD